MQWIAEDPGRCDKAPRGPSRRSHTKSRRGCQKCKARRVKCDETRPRCAQCLKHDLSCVYGQPPFHDEATTSSNDAEDGRYKTIILKHLADLDIADEHNLNGQIYDHLLQHKELWLGTPEIQRVLQTHGPRWATQAPHLLHALMAGSAAHLAHCNPDTVSYSTIHDLYYTLSLQSFASQLSRPITRENMDPLIACSIVHGPMAFWKQGQDNAVETPFRWVRTIKGVPVILAEIADPSWIEQSEWHEYTLQAGGHNAQKLSLPEDSAVIPWANTVLRRFERLCEVVADRPSVYAAPLRHLSMLLRMDNHNNRSSAVLRFIAHLSADFINLLEHGDARALLIFSYWYGLMCNVKQWWAVQHSLNGCKRLCELLADCEDHRVQELLEWPMTQTGMIQAP